MAKKFNFVVFEEVGGKFKSDMISLSKHGGFGFNAGFCRKHNIKSYSYVILSFDRENKAVGFRFTKKPKEKGAWKLAHTGNSATVVVHSFFNGCGVEPKDFVGRYQPKEYNDTKLGKLFYIILRKRTSKPG
jgi:hypothetical protein